MKSFSKLQKKLEGELLDSVFDRGRYATDASIYQIMPKAIVLPKSVSDIKASITFARENGLKVLPRGAGTSQNGQTVNDAIVLDNSKYLKRLLSLDLERNRCVVEPGLVLDELNNKLKPYGLWFPVDVSTSSQATLGGMVGNNSAGGSSIRYGIMRDNVHSIKVLLANGRQATFGPLKEKFFGIDDILPQLLALGHQNREEILEKFPKVLRRVGGYNIDALLPETLATRPGSDVATDDINLAHLIVGSEGTLAFITEIELKLAPIPPKKIMSLCHFSSFYEAMDAVQYLVPLDPMTVELIDDTMISLASSIPLFHKTVRDFISGTPAALLVVEFAEENAQKNKSKVQALQSVMAGLSAKTQKGPLSTNKFQNQVVVLDSLVDQNRISEMRKSGLNIMMSMKSEEKPVSFVEDCAVPLADLAEYTQGLTNIFKKHGTYGTWYAHASVGCLHVRPLLNMKKPEDVLKMRSIATEAFELVKTFAGSHSGEHGDGISRSEFNPVMFGAKLTTAFQMVKSIFDPNNLFNPGKIVDPLPMDSRELFRFGPDYTVANFKTQLNWSNWSGEANGLQGAIEMCNNNGICRKLKGGVMCPSFRATRNEKDSTRGRANSLRMAISGQLGPGALTSEAMAKTLELCVSCKACKRECPTGVDMAAMKLEVNAQRLKEKGLTIHDRLIAYLPDYAPVAAKMGPILNLRDKVPGLCHLSEFMTGFSAKRPLPIWRSDWFRTSEVSSKAFGEKPVILFIDTFNRFFEPQIIRSAVKVLSKAGYSVFAPSPMMETGKALCCGKTHLSVGNIEKARKSAELLVATYAPYATAGIPIVGLEPSCLLALRDEVPSLLKNFAAAEVARMAKTFEEVLVDDTLGLEFKSLKAKVLLHGHCHQKAFDVMQPIEKLLHKIEGLELETIDSSCCGMAGAFGYGRGTHSISKKMGEVSLLPKVRDASLETLIISDGFSCRTQIKDETQRSAMHVASLLEKLLS